MVFYDIVFPCELPQVEDRKNRTSMLIISAGKHESEVRKDSLYWSLGGEKLSVLEYAGWYPIITTPQTIKPCPLYSATQVQLRLEWVAKKSPGKGYPHLPLDNERGNEKAESEAASL